MSNRDGREASGRPTQSTVSSTTTTHGPTITTTTYTATGPQTTVITSAPHATTIVSPTVTTTLRTPLQQAPSLSASQPERQPSIRIRRAGAEPNIQSYEDDGESYANRRRSFSEPERPQPALLQEIDDLEIRRHTSATPLQTLHEEGSGYSVPQVGYYTSVVPERNPRRPGYVRQTSAISLRHSRNLPAGEYDADVVDVLDVIGTHMRSMLTNIANYYPRSRGFDAHDIEQCSEQFVPTELWTFLRPSPYVRTLAIGIDER